jgi:hypothetical protein
MGCRALASLYHTQRVTQGGAALDTCIILDIIYMLNDRNGHRNMVIITTALLTAQF